MTDNNKMSDEEIRKAVEGKANPPEVVPSTTGKKTVTPTQKVETEVRMMPKTIRPFIHLGTGDAGANVVSVIKRSTDQFSVIYNTSSKGLDNLSFDKAIIPDAEDGSGKDRSYSKSVFKNGPHEKMLNTVQSEIERTAIFYVAEYSSADGGTGGGSAPNAVKYLRDNLRTKSGGRVPVIAFGIYPDLTQDAKSLFNALSWQTEIEKIEAPYFVFDNNTCKQPTAIAHEKINGDIVEVARILAGQVYGETNISAIDNRDVFKLVSHGGRLALYTSKRRPKMDETLDSYIVDMITSSSQPEPLNPTAYGLFIKGPESVIKDLDVSISQVREKYGYELEKFVHIEIADEVQISLMVAGCAPPIQKLKIMRAKYDELLNSRGQNDITAASFADGLKDPFSLKKETERNSDKIDKSALEI